MNNLITAEDEANLLYEQCLHEAHLLANAEFKEGNDALRIRYPIAVREHCARLLAERSKK